MAGLSDLRIRITADGTQATRAMQQVGGGMGRLRSEAAASERAMSALRGTFMGLAAAVASGFGISRLGGAFMEANRAAGMMRGSLETVTGSVQKASDAWDVLQGFAATTPFDMKQVVESFILLKARGLDPSMESLRSFGNTASAMAKPLKQMIEAVADASTGSFVRLEEFGIKASKSGDKVSLTFNNVTKTIGTSAKEIQEFLLSIGNIDFAGATDRQAKTLEGAISNLGDAWAQMWVQIGDTGLTAGVSAVIRDLGDGLADLGDYLTMADGAGDAFTQTLAEMGKAVAATYAELKSGVWSDTTVVIMATAGAVAGATGLMLGLKAAIGLVTIAWGLFTAVLLANPVTLAIVAVGALAGALYTLRDETIQVGTTTTTVGAVIEAVWDTTASYSQAVWETFADFVAGEFNKLPPVVTAAGQSVVSVWSVTMSNLMAISDTAINYVMNLFRWVGRSAGVLAGEIAMSVESGFNWERLKSGLAGAVEYTDMLGEANTKATAAIAAAGKAIEDKAGAIADSNLEEQLGARSEEHTSELQSR
jgi:phage tail tape-measure protein